MLGVPGDAPDAISIAAFVRSIVTRTCDRAEPVLDLALAMHPTAALAFGFGALVSSHGDNVDRPIDHAAWAPRLSPLDDPPNDHSYCALAPAHLVSGRNDETAASATLAIRADPRFSVVYSHRVASEARLGAIAAARATAERLVEIAP